MVHQIDAVNVKMYNIFFHGSMSPELPRGSGVHPPWSHKILWGNTAVLMSKTACSRTTNITVGCVSVTLINKSWKIRYLNNARLPEWQMRSTTQQQSHQDAHYLETREAEKITQKQR